LARRTSGISGGELILTETVVLKTRVACNLSDFLSNRQMAVLVAALTALAAVVMGGIVILTDQLFEARLERARAVPMIADTSNRSGSTPRSSE
jgi:hypothetical protein